MKGVANVAEGTEYTASLNASVVTAKPNAGPFTAAIKSLGNLMSSATNVLCNIISKPNTTQSRRLIIIIT